MSHVENLRSALKALPDSGIPALAKSSGVPALTLRRFRDGKIADITWTHTMALRKVIRKHQVIA